MTTTAARPRSADQPAQEVEQARLHRDVEAAGRLVHEHQARAGDEIAGDLQALAHAAGEGARLDRRCGRLRSRPARASRPQWRGSCHNAGRRPPSAARRHWRRPRRVMRRPSAGFWWTKPQSVRIRKPPLRLAHPVELAPRAVAHAVTDAVPELGSSRVDRQSSSVVLPEPDSPTTASTSPGHRSKLTLRRSRCARHRISTGRGR